MEKQTVKKQKVFLSLEQLYLSIFAIILSLLITALIMLVSGEKSNQCISGTVSRRFRI